MQGVDCLRCGGNNVLAVHYPVRLIYCPAFDHGIKFGAELIVPGVWTAKVVHLEAVISLSV